MNYAVKTSVFRGVSIIGNYKENGPTYTNLCDVTHFIILLHILLYCCRLPAIYGTQDPDILQTCRTEEDKVI